MQSYSGHAAELMAFTTAGRPADQKFMKWWMPVFISSPSAWQSTTLGFRSLLTPFMIESTPTPRSRRVHDCQRRPDSCQYRHISGLEGFVIHLIVDDSVSLGSISSIKLCSTSWKRSQRSDRCFWWDNGWTISSDSEYSYSSVRYIKCIGYITRYNKCIKYIRCIGYIE